MTRLKRLNFLWILMCSFALAGCASMGEFAENPLARTTVQYAVYKYTGGDPDRAARVQDAIDEVLLVLDGDQDVTIAILKGVLQPYVDRIDDPADQFLAIGVIDFVALELAERVGDGEIREDQLLSVREVLSWARGAAFSTAVGQPIEGVS